jgi:hypothetical protein
MRETTLQKLINSGLWSTADPADIEENPETGDLLLRRCIERCEGRLRIVFEYHPGGEVIANFTLGEKEVKGVSCPSFGAAAVYVSHWLIQHSDIPSKWTLDD